MVRRIAAIFLLFTLLTVSLAKVDLSYENNNYLGYSFKQYKQDFEKTYTGDEETLRKKYFQKQLDIIQRYNSDQKNAGGYKKGINQFSDMTEEEFALRYLHYTPTTMAVERATVSLQNIPLPKEIDWVRMGKVTSIKNQEPCGGCYAFTALAAIESAYLISKSWYLQLSVQQIVDCSFEFGNNGCWGGNAHVAYQYIEKYGVTTEERYPFFGNNDTCKFKEGEYKISSHHNIFSSCDDMARALTLGPVSVEVATDGWKQYRSGVFQSCSGPINHAVLLVGMTETYWNIKNSWGNWWGESGFMRLARGNTCDICKYPSYPII